MGVSVPGGAPGVRPRGRRRGRGQGGRKQGRRATAQPAGTGAACELDHILVVQVHPHPAALVTARHGDVDGLSRRVGRLAGRRDEVDGALGCAPVRTVRVAAVAAGDGGRVTGGAGLSAAYAVRVIVRERSHLCRPRQRDGEEHQLRQDRPRAEHVSLPPIPLRWSASLSHRARATQATQRGLGANARLKLIAFTAEATVGRQVLDHLGLDFADVAVCSTRNDPRISDRHHASGTIPACARLPPLLAPRPPRGHRRERLRPRLSRADR